MREARSIVVCVTAALAALGCLNGPHRPFVTEAIRLPETTLEHVATAAEDVLGGMHFAITKTDAEAGIITTSPLSAAEFFEVWRSDNIGGPASAQASLHSIRRTVRLQLRQRAGEVQLNCDVLVERLSLPSYHDARTGGAYGSRWLGPSDGVALRLTPRQRADMRWLPIGSDEHLAQEILRRIEKRAADPQRGQQT